MRDLAVRFPWLRGMLLLAVALGGWLLVPESRALSPGEARQSPPPAAAESGVPRFAPTGGLPSFADLAEKVLPAVVSIDARTIARESEEEPSFRFRLLPPGFGQPAPPGRRPREFRQDSGGSGFLVSPDGLVVTNHHVIEGATSVVVRLDQKEYPAKVQGSDPSTDLALLKIETDRPLSYLELGDSDRLRVGDWVMAIGNPLLLDHSVTVGVVSAKGRSIGLIDTSFENFIQTDAAINRGNSGGPLVNLEGKVVGIATAMNWGAENIGFAVPVNTLKAILPQLKEKGRVSRGYLGVGVANLTPDAAEAFGISADKGVLVQQVLEGGPAEEAGLQHGDVILEVDRQAIRSTRELIDMIASKSPGTEVELRILRDGKNLTKRVRLTERVPDSEQSGTEQAEPEEEGLEWLGLEVSDIHDWIRQQLQLPRDVSGVMVTHVAPSSVLYDRGLREGDVIFEVNGEPVSSVRQFQAQVRKVKSGQLLRLYTGRWDPALRRWLKSFVIARVP